MSPPSTPNHPNQDLIASSLLFGAGMLLPLATVIVARDLLALYLSGHAFTATVAAGFVPVAWAFVVRVDPDWPNFLTAALVVPLVAVVVVLASVAGG